MEQQDLGVEKGGALLGPTIEQYGDGHQSIGNNEKGRQGVELQTHPKVIY
jgi:hypothetical protein